MITLIMGEKGSGKTTLAAGLAHQLLNGYINITCMGFDTPKGILVLDNFVEDGVDCTAYILDLSGILNYRGTFPYNPKGQVHIPNVLRMIKQYTHTIIIAESAPKNIPVDFILRTERAKRST